MSNLNNDYAAEEARRNPARVAPQFSDDLEAFIASIEMVDRLVSKLEITIKSKDVPVIYGTFIGKATHLLTYDEANFGELMLNPCKGVKMLTPQMMIQELKGLGVIK